jgi:hypothetical protein
VNEGEEPQARDARAVVLAKPQPPPKIGLAESLETVERGQVVLLDRYGRIMSKRAVKVRLGLHSAGVAGALAAEIAGLVLGSVALLGGGFAMLLLLTHQSRNQKELLLAKRLSIVGRDAEAQVLLEAIDRRRPGGMIYFETQRELGALAWRRGELAAALARFKSALDMVTPAKNAVGYWLTYASLVEVQLELDHAAAEGLIARLDGAPDTPLFRAEREYIELMFAFHSNHTRGLPADETLYEWAKSALISNVSGLRIGLLAWAFEQRGDGEMATHLLREVRSHLLRDFQESRCFAPKLGDWLEPRMLAAEAEATEVDVYR